MSTTLLRIHVGIAEDKIHRENSSWQSRWSTLYHW